MQFPNNFQQMLSNMNPQKISQAMNVLNNLNKTQEGQQLLGQLQGMNGSDLAGKLSDPNVLNMLTQNMQNVNQEAVKQQLAQNPQILNMIQQYLNNQNGGGMGGR